MSRADEAHAEHADTDATRDHAAHAPRPIGGPNAPVSGETEPIVLSHGNLFCVVNRRGNIAPAGARDLGLFYEDMRHLSRLELWISGGPPIVLSAETGASSSQIDLTLTDREYGGFIADPQNFLHLRRRQLLDGPEYVERISLTNHLSRRIEVRLAIALEADFADIFEVRGARRDRRGTLLPPEPSGARLVFGYHGVDGETYRTVVEVTPDPEVMDATGPRWRLALQAGESIVLELTVRACRGPLADVAWRPFDVRTTRLAAARRRFLDGCTQLHGSNPRFDALLARALADIDSLRIPLGDSNGNDDSNDDDACADRIVGAGIPWYAAPFGRDAIITSLECLLVAPSLARETLRTLARYQGSCFDAWREEEPGRILHELRRGEMTRVGEAPHSPYYGTIDATPLWIMLLSETWRWTGDDALLAELMPHAERALAWIERRQDEGGGFVRYQRTHARGLVNQGWKDSQDGVSFPDGRVAEAPIALVEVQGYVVAALDAMGRLRRRRGDVLGGALLHRKANALRRRIDDAFWVPESGYYALALDGAGRRVETLTSNPGHLGFCRAYVSRARADRVADMLLSDAAWSGWGIRTLARGQAVYNPLSYHNGSVWPHDNALCALGLAMNERGDAAHVIFDALYAASLHFRDLRLPELFCGMARGEGDFLVHYPVSCSPQAWASGAFFLLIQAALGIRPDAPLARLVIRNPRLPGFLDRLELHGMQVGPSKVSLRFTRHGQRTHVDLVDVTGDARLKVNIEIG